MELLIIILVFGLSFASRLSKGQIRAPWLKELKKAIDAQKGQNREKRTGPLTWQEQVPVQIPAGQFDTGKRSLSFAEERQIAAAKAEDDQVGHYQPLQPPADSMPGLKRPQLNAQVPRVGNAYSSLSRHDLIQGVVMGEVLGRPKALRTDQTNGQ